MADLNATDLNDLQPSGGIDEKRYSSRGLVDLAADSTQSVDFIPPSVMERMRTIGSQRSIQNPAINDQTPTVVTTPGFSFIPSNLPTSAQYTFTAVDVFSGMRFFPSTYAENSIDAEWEKKRRMKNILYQMAVTKESLISSVLETIKTQTLNGLPQVNGASAGTFTFSSDVLTADLAAQTDTMFTNIEQLYSINEIPGDIRYVTNRGGLHPQIVSALKYGAGNDKNLQALGLPDPTRYYETTSIAAGSDIFNGFAVRDGAIGLVSNHPYSFSQGITLANGKEWSVSDMEMEYTRSRLNVFVNQDASDNNSIVASSNSTMDHFQEMALWDRFYIVYPYNSDRSTRVGDVIKISGAAS